MMHRKLFIIGAGVLLLGACKDSTSVPDLNNVSAETIKNGLNRSSLQLLITGLLNQDRANVNGTYVVFTETMARDLYRIDAAEPRFITELIGAPADPGGFVGGGLWTGWYTAIRAANTILDDLDGAKGLTDAEKSATRGFVQTIKAIQYYHVWETHDTTGAPIDVDRPIDAPLADIRCAPAVLAYVSALLDSAYTNLQAGGSAFPFTLPPGYTLQGDFSTPATFANFYNRGWAGKVDVYRGLALGSTDAAALQRAITELNTAIDANGGTGPAALARGVYYTFSTAPGETQNALADAAIHLNPAVCDSIQSGDLRESKLVRVADAFSGYGVSTKCNAAAALATTDNLTRPLPSLRGAELVLLRAQAEIALNQLAAATADVNIVRTTEGGLPALPVFTSQTEGIDAVLYEKRYSLLLEGAQRLVDLRSYGRLNAQYLRKETTEDVFQSALPISKRESDARSGNLACKP